MLSVKMMLITLNVVRLMLICLQIYEYKKAKGTSEELEACDGSRMT